MSCVALTGEDLQVFAASIVYLALAFGIVGAGLAMVVRALGDSAFRAFRVVVARRVSAEPFAARAARYELLADRWSRRFTRLAERTKREAARGH